MFPTEYKYLKENNFKVGDFEIVPIRYEDKFLIMKWRNEQIYHLRQSRPLTFEDQENYFKHIVSKLFDQAKPDQILFSYLRNGVCIGYGGLVHINWIDKNAEISFIIDTSLEKEEFAHHWGIYLGLIEQVAFGQLNFHKIYTYAFDLRPHLYSAIERVGYRREAILKEHCLFEGQFLDVHIHCKINHGYLLRRAEASDCKLYFDWANDESVRVSSFNSDPVVWENHENWFNRRIISPNTQMYVLEQANTPVGQIRLEWIEDQWLIGFSVDSNYRGKGIGKELVQQIIKIGVRPLKALVKPDNISSMRVFQSLGFKEESESYLNQHVAAFYLDR